MLRYIRPVWYQTIIFGAIVLLAAVLRLWAIGWGLPYIDHPDEPAVAESALGMLRYHDWNPRFFDYPSFYLYALRIVFDAHWRYGLATGLYNSSAQIPHFTRPYEHPNANYLVAPGFFLWGRALTAIFGTITVALVYVVGRRWWSPSVGLVAALVLATLPFHIRHSQYITVDAATAMTTLIAVAMALRLLERGDLRSYALAGVGVGLATTTKYNAGAVILAVLIAHTLRCGRDMLRQSWRMLWSGVWMLAIFVAISPYSALTYSHFTHGIMLQYNDYAGGHHGNLIGRWPVWGYARFFATEGMEPLPALATLLGLGVVVARRDRAGLTILAFVVPYLLFFLSWPEHFFRNLLPLIPPLALLAGIGICTVGRSLAPRIEAHAGGRQIQTAFGSPSAIGRLAVTALTLVVILLPLINSLQLDQFNVQADPRVQAEHFIETSLPPGALVAAELNPAQVSGDPNVIPVASLTDHDLAWYRAHGISYLVANERYRNLRSPEVYRQLLSSARVLRIFGDGIMADDMEPATPLARTFAGRYCTDRVNVLTLQASPGSSLAEIPLHQTRPPSGATCEHMRPEPDT
jgi:hypothetical protein